MIVSRDYSAYIKDTVTKSLKDSIPFYTIYLYTMYKIEYSDFHYKNIPSLIQNSVNKKITNSL
jgi:hypothetical protein